MKVWVSDMAHSDGVPVVGDDLALLGVEQLIGVRHVSNIESPSRTLRRNNLVLVRHVEEESALPRSGPKGNELVQRGESQWMAYGRKIVPSCKDRLIRDAGTQFAEVVDVGRQRGSSGPCGQSQ